MSVLTNLATIPTASVADLLDTYVELLADAKHFAGLGYDCTSTRMRENAEAIAAEFERRCVR